MHSHHYGTKIIRISASLIVAIFMTLHGRWHEIGRALITPTFYFSVFISFCIAYLLMYFVDFVTTLLDMNYPINDHPVKRVLLQIFACIFIPTLLDVILMYFYFKVLGRDLFETTYLLVDLPIVITFLLALNAYYLLNPDNRLSKKSYQSNNVEPLVINHDGIHLTLNPVTDILYCYKDKKLVRVFTTSGKEYGTKTKIEAIIESYKPANFCQINPSAVVNLCMVKGYVPGITRETWNLVFLMEHQATVKHADLKVLRVTKTNFEKFKKSLEDLNSK